MKKTVFILILLCPFLFSCNNVSNQKIPVQEKPDKADIIMTSLDAVCALACSLTEGTDIRTINIFPTGCRLSNQRFKIKRVKKDICNYAEKATAVITIRGAWPEDPLYSFARQYNIRTVEIDASIPFNNKSTGVSLIRNKKIKGVDSTEAISPFIWLSISNYLKMSDIVSTDLKKLFPLAKEKIELNHENLKRELFKLKTGYEEKFLQFDMLEAIALTDDFIYLTDDFNIDVTDYFTKSEIDWTQKDLLALKNSISAGDISCIICKYEPDTKISEAIKNAGATIVVLDTINPAREKYPLKHSTYSEIMKSNLERLYTGLKR